MAESANVCQYWSVDENGKAIEPGLCPNWDVTNAICTFEKTDAGGNVVRASFYPHCNLIGTQAQCNQYEGTGVQKRCIAPDFNRHVVNRKTGKKWAIKSVISDDGKNTVTTPADYSAITGYNDGECDGFGTGTGCGIKCLCAAYSPHHMGFSALTPTDDEEIDKDGFTTISGFAMRLPLDFVIYNVRAKLSRCYWWQHEVEEFTIDSDLESATFSKVKTVTFRCTNTDEIVQNYSGDVGNGFKWDNELKRHRAPCNGAKPECPNYTSGVCWEYCVDSKTQHGDKVLAEQILELRYYMRKNRWIKSKYEKSFKEPDINAWTGDITIKSSNTTNIIGNKLMYEIPVQRASIVFKGDAGESIDEDERGEVYNAFEVVLNKAVLTEGVMSEDHKKRFPDLVREIRDPILTPIIKNKFDKINKENIFEVTDITHKYIPIFGDIFYYNSSTYGLNLNDTDLRFPGDLASKLRQHDSMQDIKIALDVDKNDPKFDDFYNKLECTLDWMTSAMPDKMILTEFGKNENLFYINMHTFFGDNDIFVFTKGNGRWEFDKISVKKIFCGGVIGQTGFSIEGDEGDVNYLPNYENDFGAYSNKNGEIKFKFNSLVSEQITNPVHYTYDDSVRKRIAFNPVFPPAVDTYDVSYKLYEIKVFANKIISMEEMRFIGNSGHVLVTILDEDKALSRVISTWALEDTIYLNYPDGNKCEMKVYNENNDELEPNQIILKPKNIDEFRDPCSDSTIVSDIYVYEKRSFGEEPEIKYVSKEEVDDGFLSEDDNLNDRSAAVQKEEIGEEYVLTQFGYDPLMISAVFKGSNGRVKGQTKTKMITWVRQPYCRDVEIKYDWSAKYSCTTLEPENNAYGKIGFRPCTTGERGELLVGMVTKGYTPPCGDHDLSFRSGLGPMWYPYDDCESSVRYNITGALTEWAINIMEVFLPDYPDDPPHGQHDMRMLGPADNFGWTCDTHASLWLCQLDWSYCNLERKTENLFTGYGRYRGGLSLEDKVKAANLGGSLPQFGDTYRDFLRSFRSMDNIDYYYFSGGKYTRKRKWVPVPEFYTNTNITSAAYNYPYFLYCSSDYYDDKAQFIDPMGLMGVTDSIEGVTIRESIKLNSLTGEAERYRFEDVFITHSTLAGLYYPYPRQPYSVGSNLATLIPWYTYKDIPGDGVDESIQWAWREIWKDLERGTADMDNITCPSSDETCCPPTIIEGDCLFSAPYYIAGCEDNPVGRHLFLDIQYPEYKYDALLGEHRLVIVESTDNYQTITVIPPNFEVRTDAGDEKINEFFWAKIGTGPYRAFDLDGDWDPSGSDESNPAGDGDNDYYDLYTTCTTSPWVTDVTLFASGYTDKSESVAEADGRMIKTYDGAGDEVKTYYQRGLNISISSSLLDYVAKKAELISSDEYDISLSKQPDSSGTDFGDVVPGELYPGVNEIDISYSVTDVVENGGDLYVTINIKIYKESQSEDQSEESGIGAISRVDCVFKLGDSAGKLYHIPAIDISVDGASKYQCTSMTIVTPGDDFSTDRCSYSWTVTAEDIFNVKNTEAGKRKIKKERIAAGIGHDDIDTSTTVELMLRLSPTSDELEDLNTAITKLSIEGDEDVSYEHVVNIKDIYIYHSNFTDSDEKIKTYERKYNISTGYHGDVASHGHEGIGSLLYPQTKDRSTVYQYDTSTGMVGMPSSAGRIKTMSKCRGRIMFETHEDKEELDVEGVGLGWLHKAEDKQKEIHDAIINEGSTSFSMKALSPPSLDDKFTEVGITFPSWNCSFTNTLVRPLQPVAKYGTYSPQGHKFIHDFSLAEKITNCSAYGSLHNRKTEDVFEYSFIQVYTGTGAGEIDALTAYFRGIGQITYNPMHYIGSQMAWSEELSDIIRSSGVGIRTLLDLPDPVDSLT